MVLTRIAPLLHWLIFNGAFCRARRWCRYLRSPPRHCRRRIQGSLTRNSAAGGEYRRALQLQLDAPAAVNPDLQPNTLAGLGPLNLAHYLQTVRCVPMDSSPVNAKKGRSVVSELEPYIGPCRAVTLSGYSNQDPYRTTTVFVIYWLQH